MPEIDRYLYGLPVQQFAREYKLPSFSFLRLDFYHGTIRPKGVVR
jgi:hypothetical protein